jgi:hypothetical protein
VRRTGTVHEAQGLQQIAAASGPILPKTASTMAKKRLAKRSQKNWPRVKLRGLFIELLEFRSWYLKSDVPIQAKEISKGTPFHKYLELCLALAEPHANKRERAEMWKQGRAHERIDETAAR